MVLSISAPPAAAPQSPDLSIDAILAPLFEAAAESSSLLASLHPVADGRRAFGIPKFLLLGERGGGVPIRVALFAGLDAGSIDTVLAISRLLLQYRLNPRLARDFAIFAYPVVHVPGFMDENAALAEFEQRYAEDRADADVQFFKSELTNWAFDGLISFRTDPQLTGFRATVRSEVLGAEVVKPALESVSRSLPLDAEALVRLPASKEGRLADLAKGKLTAIAGDQPAPFEIELFTPGGIPIEQRVTGLFLIVQEMLRNYRRMISHAQHL